MFRYYLYMNGIFNTVHITLFSVSMIWNVEIIRATSNIEKCIEDVRDERKTNRFRTALILCELLTYQLRASC